MGQVRISYRQGGEKIRPVGRQHHHDLKTLLQAQGVPTWQRERIPLLYINQQLAAVLGYWVAHEFA
jgi:tRNA(Ile)-lysidine synthase